MIAENNSTIAWLLEDDNPPVQYRTRTELLGETAEKAPVISWLRDFQPKDWQETKGLWSTYWLTSVAECGLSFGDISIDAQKAASFYDENIFDCGCGDFMRLRALLRIGLMFPDFFFDVMKDRQLPDGGFLCLHRLNKLNRTPKSCMKANMHALMFCSACRSRGIRVDFEEKLLSYFWNHNIFYRADDTDTLVLNAREGWRAIDTFYPFEVMRVGLQNLIEAFCTLGYGNDERLKRGWELLGAKKTESGRYLLDGTLSKSYLPKERCKKPGKWVTFYALLAEKKREWEKPEIYLHAFRRGGTFWRSELCSDSGAIGATESLKTPI